MAPTFRLRPRGAFSLGAATAFAEGFPGTRTAPDADGLTIAWAVDGDWRTAVATLHQTEKLVLATPDARVPDDLAPAARRDLERILSLDVDGTGFERLARGDRVVGALQRRFAGLRPVLFYTPYEAAAWTIIGHRIRMTQAATIKQRLAEELGVRGAFPAPERLLTLDPQTRGLTAAKVAQLHGIADAARAGRLDRDRLRAMPYDDALADLQQLRGVGPFSAELILIRAVGAPDAAPTHERRLERAVRAAYELDDDADITATTDRWRPYRAWVALLLRAWLEAETQEIAHGRTRDVHLDPPTTQGARP